MVKQFYTPLVLSSSQEAASAIINDSLSISTNVTNTINTIASSVPFSIYFLSFLNYFTLSSLYVLLNFPIPEQIYSQLSSLYSQINANLFQILDINIQPPPFSY
jgi:hypothetical protein